MGRVTITPTTLIGDYPSLPVSADAMDLGLTAADTSNNNQILLDRPVIVVAFNSGATPRTITFTSAADPQNRTGDISTYSIGAGEIAVKPFLKTDGWKQADGYLYLQANNAEVKIGVIRLP